MMLARALVARPRLLLIRETLDTLAEDVRERALAAVLGPGLPWTVVLVSHDRDVIAACDRVFELGTVKRVSAPLPSLKPGGAVGAAKLEGGAA